VYRDKLPTLQQRLRNDEKNQGYLDLVKRGNIWDAYALIKETCRSLFGYRARVLPPCETACNRGQYDEAISIRAVERFLGDLGPGTAARRGEARETQRKKVAVVVRARRHSAAYQLARLGYKVTSLRNRPKAGGLIAAASGFGFPSEYLDRESSAD